MFKRLLFENLGGLLPAAGFVLTAIAFTLILVRALVMRKAEAARMAHLPLSDTAPDETEPSNPPSPTDVQAPR